MFEPALTQSHHTNTRGRVQSCRRQKSDNEGWSDSLPLSFSPSGLLFLPSSVSVPVSYSLPLSLCVYFSLVSVLLASKAKELGVSTRELRMFDQVYGHFHNNTTRILVRENALLFVMEG